MNAGGFVMLGPGSTRFRCRRIRCILEPMFDRVNQGDPHPSLREVRALRPPKPVWVDLARVFAFGEPLGVYPHGLDLQAVVPGMIHQWHRTTTGHWAGWASYKFGGEFGGQRAAHWVGSYAMDPRREGSTR